MCRGGSTNASMFWCIAAVRRSFAEKSRLKDDHAAVRRRSGRSALDDVGMQRLSPIISPLLSTIVLYDLRSGAKSHGLPET